MKRQQMENLLVQVYGATTERENFFSVEKNKFDELRKVFEILEIKYSFHQEKSVMKNNAFHQMIIIMFEKNDYQLESILISTETI